MPAQHFRSPNNRCEIWCLVHVYRRWHGNNMKASLFEPRCVGGELHRRAPHARVSHLSRRIDPFLVRLDLRLVNVETDDINMFREFDGDRHADVAKSDNGELSFSVSEFIANTHLHSFTRRFDLTTPGEIIAPA